MKKTVFGLSLLAGALAFAGVDNVVVTFSTQGPDKYADGTKVCDGEVYALVWTKDGATFGGIDANGAAADANSKVLLRAPVAKDGHCPLVQFQIDEDFWTKEGLANGSLAVCLLDTRRFKTDANGVIGTEVASVGLGSGLVNGYGLATDKIASSGISSASAAGTGVGTPSVAPVDAQKPVIRDIKVIGENVYIYVTGTSPAMSYVALQGTKPGALASGGGAQYGVGASQDMIIIRPKTGDTGFFQVDRK